MNGDELLKSSGGIDVAHLKGYGLTVLDIDREICGIRRRTVDPEEELTQSFDCRFTIICLLNTCLAECFFDGEELI